MAAISARPFKIENSDGFSWKHRAHAKHQALLLPSGLDCYTLRAHCECGEELTVTMQEFLTRPKEKTAP